VRVDQYGYEEDLTAQTDFTITEGGECTKDGAQASCSATQVKDYTVTGTLRDSRLSATATLTVVPGPTTALRLDPEKAEIQAGASQPYKAIGVDRYGNDTVDLTERTDFTITEGGECTKDGAQASCSATQVKDYTVTGTLRDSRLSATATLTVVPGPTTSTTTTTIAPTTSTTTTTIAPTTSTTTTTIAPTTSSTGRSTSLTRLELRPAKASIVAGARQAYAVEGFADDGTSLGNVTAATSFSIGPDGACDGASCSATTAGMHIVTGTVTQGGRRISGLAELQVLHRQPTISSVEPGFTFPGMSVEVGGNTGSCNRAGKLTFHGMTGDVSVKVTADQQGNFIARVTIPRGTFPRAYELELTVDCNGQLQRAQAELTVLNLAPVAADDSANTTPDTPVSIDVLANDRNPDPDTGYQTLVVESRPPTHGTIEVRSDQTVVYTPEKGFVGQDRFQYSFCDDIINAAGSADCGTATVTVRTSPTACLPSAGDTPRLQVDPGKGPGGAKVRITATVDRRLATCPFRLLLGGTPLGPDVRVGSDGSISAERGVPKDAKPGPSPMRLATVGAQTLAETPFEVVPPGLSLLLKLLIGAGVLVASALARAVFRRWRAPQEKRARHEPDPPPEDIRAEPHTSPVEVTVEPKRDNTRTFTVRLEPHHDAGTQTLQEMTP
jgi:hypothetical protein